MICDSCKSEVPDDARTCKFCGQTVGKAATIEGVVALIAIPFMLWWTWKYLIPWLQASGFFG